MFNKSFWKKPSKYLALASVGIVTFGVIALADYVEPASTAPNSNTPEVLKTTGATALTYDKLGIGNGDYNFVPTITVLKDGSWFGVHDTKVDKKYGVFSDKLVSTGANKIGTNKIPEDFIIQVIDKNNKGFDQYILSGIQFKKFPGEVDTTPKPLETLYNGRFVSKFAITDSADNGPKRLQDPNYTLDFQPTSSFSPTTNIGLGDSCNLYPVDIGTTVGDGGGCPAGSYISYYKQPTFSGTLSTTNNTNSQTVATCTQFNPSASPKNTGHCTSKVFTNLNYVEKVTGTPVCTYYAASSISYGGGINLSSFKGKNAKVKWYNGGTYTPSLDNKTTFTYGCGSGPWKVIATDDYGQYAEGEE